MSYTIQQVNKAFNELPEELQEFILSDEVADTIHLIDEEYLVPQSRKEDFVLKILAMLSGIYFSDEFLQDIEREYNLSEDTAVKILLDVNEAILEPADYLLTSLVGNIPGDTSNAYASVTRESAFAENSQDSSIKTHILDEIEHPRPTPIMSEPRPIQAPRPAPRPISPPPQPLTRPAEPIHFPTARVVQPATAPRVNPGLISRNNEPIHNLDMHPSIPEYTEEELLPLIIRNSKEAQANSTHAPIIRPIKEDPIEFIDSSGKKIDDPYREPPVS
jgi:hypothetical protein